MTDYFNAFATIARRHANQIEDGAHVDPRERPEEPKLVDGEWVHGVGCPCDACQRDAWVSAKEVAGEGFCYRCGEPTYTTDASGHFVCGPHS